jgi:hypothetical protein
MPVHAGPGLYFQECPARLRGLIHEVVRELYLTLIETDCFLAKIRNNLEKT